MNMPDALSLFSFVILIMSIIVHEVAHGLAAEYEGDDTARNLGRITLNPLKHIDWIGSVLLPLILILSQAGAIFGWAKPVPYNSRNLAHGKKSEAIVSIAGIGVNLTIAIFFGLIVRGALYFGWATMPLVQAASIIVFMNSILALFNAIPLAPLDGFRFLQAVLPQKAQPTLHLIEQYSLPLLLLFILFGWSFVAPLASIFYTLLTGVHI